MNDFENITGYEIIYVIVNYGMGSNVLHKAKEYGVPGGTVYIGRGTVNNPLLNFLSLNDERKEIILMGADNITTNYALDKLNKEFNFKKSNHGIAFTVSSMKMVGSRTYNVMNDNLDETKREDKHMYQIITTVVNKGRAEDVIEAAKEAGSKGGTVINARGSGEKETAKLFNMEIEPQKEIVLILSKADTVDNIVKNISEKLDIEKAGNGIIFVQDVARTIGVVEDK